MVIKEKLIKACEKIIKAIDEKLGEAQRIKKKAELSSIILQKSKNYAIWQYQMFQTLPEKAEKIFDESSINEINQYNNNLGHYFTKSDALEHTTTEAMSVTSTNIPYSYINRIETSFSEPTILEWANNQKESYNLIFEAQNKINIIKEKLIIINKERVNEFEKAIHLYESFEAGVGNLTSAAISMRNVIEHLKGDLFEIARNKPKEQKIQWKDMAERLAVNEPSSMEHITLEKEEYNYNELHDDLTKYSKNLKKVKNDFQTIYIMFINHLFTLLELIKV